MTEEPKLRWDYYLIEAEPGLMLTAKVEIIARELEFLLPMTWRRAYVEGSFKPVPEPRLPGRYAFVRLPCDPEDPHHTIINEQAAAVKAFQGVREVYKNASGHYAIVQKWEIQALKDAEAKEHREAAKANAKITEPIFKKDAKVRILRHEKMDMIGRIGTFLFSVRGMASLAMGNGIKLPVPDCDIAEVDSSVAHRLAG